MAHKISGGSPLTPNERCSACDSDEAIVRLMASRDVRYFRCGKCGRVVMMPYANTPRSGRRLKPSGGQSEISDHSAVSALITIPWRFMGEELTLGSRAPSPEDDRAVTAMFDLF
jgi:hypothetical protein